MPDNPNARRTFATLRIWGMGVDPTQVTTLLGVTPSETHAAGAARGTHTTWPHGYWEVTSNTHVGSTDLAEHIAWLLDQVEPARTTFARLRQQAGVSADIFCYWESRTGHGGPEFSSDLLQRLVQFDLSLGIDIYVALDDEEDASPA